SDDLADVFGRAREIAAELAGVGEHAAGGEGVAVGISELGLPPGEGALEILLGVRDVSLVKECAPEGVEHLVGVGIVLQSERLAEFESAAKLRFGVLVPCDADERLAEDAAHLCL